LTSVLDALAGDRLWIEAAFPLWPAALSPPPPACAGPLDLLFAVHSSPSGAARRAVTRGTWGDPRALAPHTSSALLFFLGRSPDPGIEAEVAAERRVYGDLVQGGFEDTYRNLTIKHAFTLRWVTEACAGARWIARVDDDVAVNPFALSAALRAADAAPGGGGEADGYWGHARARLWVPKRGASKHATRAYADRKFPPYAHGYALALRQAVAARLVAAMDSTPMLWLEDAWSGILRAKARVGLLDVACRCCLDERGDGCAGSDERAAALWFSHCGGGHYAAAMPHLWARMLETMNEHQEDAVAAERGPAGGDGVSSGGGATAAAAAPFAPCPVSG